MSAPASPAAPLKVDKAALPVSDKSVTANVAAAGEVVRKFAEQVGLKVPEKLMPTRVTKEQIPSKRYHIGSTWEAPFNCMYVGNQGFPKVSGSVLRNPAAPDSTQMFQQIGDFAYFTDEQIESLIKKSTRQAWRLHGDRNASARWEAIDLDKTGNVFAPGDVLTASFIYIRPLAEGEMLTPVMVDDKTNLPTGPQPTALAA